MSPDANNSPTSHSASYGQCGSQISLQLRLRLYASFVIPVLTYNMGTWGLTQADLVRIDTYHRRHLRQAYSCFGPEISPSATFQITNYVGYG